VGASLAGMSAVPYCRVRQHTKYSFRIAYFKGSSQRSSCRGRIAIASQLFSSQARQVTVLDHLAAELADLAEAENGAVHRGRKSVAQDGPTDRGSIIVADDWQTLWELPFEGLQERIIDLLHVLSRRKS
jgi:hypothetical protein